MTLPIYNAQILEVNAAETRRYAGLRKAENFDEKNILDACEEAIFLLDVRGVWKVYDYDCAKNLVMSVPPFKLEGRSITSHLAACEKVICLAVTVGENIEQEVTKNFSAGQYVASVLLDAAATAAVEQATDSLEKAIAPTFVKEGYKFKSRFSPGYGDWKLDNQKNFFEITGAREIGMSLTSALMLMPRKSVTAIIGLEKISSEKKISHTKKSCATCNRKDCYARKTSEN